MNCFGARQEAPEPREARHAEARDGVPAGRRGEAVAAELGLRRGRVPHGDLKGKDSKDFINKSYVSLIILFVNLI